MTTSGDHPTSSSDKIPVTILTGFLGSGKTTLLSHLIRQPALSNAAVIINEFGEISLDHELIEKTDGDVVEIQGGCLCCTVRGDLVKALHDLMLKRTQGTVRAFDRIVIETTGLADPAPILQTLMSDPLAFTKFRLDGIITTVEAVNGAATLDAHEEAVKQAAVADRMILTKLDMAADAALEARLKKLNPGAGFIKADHGRIDPTLILNLGPFNAKAKGADVEAWLKAEAYHDAHEHHDHEHNHGHDHDHHHEHDHHDVNRHDDHIQAFCFTHDKPIEQAKLQFFLQLLVMLRGPDLLRVKGLVNVADRPNEPAVIHGVQHIFHPLTWLERWPSADTRTRIVFIVRDIAPKQITELMTSLTASPEQR
ncbi:MAG: GTP-binding protein [Rhodospirillaceae bacterium]|nr:GTP-binding protein [Rhodospirillaceae bacterium]